LENVSKQYHHHHALQNICVVFEKGFFHMITGPNGSGKSTMLKCIMGILHFEGNIQKANVRIGYAPEQFIMPEYLSVYDFLIQMGRIKARGSKQIESTLDEYLSMFELASSKNQLIGNLSKGMKQKLNIIQALIHQPQILLLDEPTNAMDINAEKRLISLLKAMSKDVLIIISTHEPDKFTFRNKKIYHLSEGRLMN